MIFPAGRRPISLASRTISPPGAVSTLKNFLGRVDDARVEYSFKISNTLEKLRTTVSPNSGLASNRGAGGVAAFGRDAVSRGQGSEKRAENRVFDPAFEMEGPGAVSIVGMIPQQSGKNL